MIDAAEDGTETPANARILHDDIDWQRWRAAQRQTMHSQATKPLPRFHPDFATDVYDAAAYTEYFVPAVVPFQRWIAFDAVQLAEDGVTPVLALSPGGVRALPEQPSAGGREALAEHDIFRAIVPLRLEAGAVRFRLPSVAATVELVEAHSVPPLTWQLELDAADNLWGHAHSAMPQSVQLRYGLAARRDGFSLPPLPTVRLDALPYSAPSMPLPVRQQGLRAAADLGVHPAQTLNLVLPRLVAHFRSFVAAAWRPQTEDRRQVLARLVAAKVGMCRHRAYGFVVLAQALGLPSRFVANEMHAWVEVQLPSPGTLDVIWRRIDLGGTAEVGELRGIAGKPRYRSPAADNLPQPLSYRRNLALARRRQGSPLRRQPGSETAPVHLVLERQRFELGAGETLTVRGRALTTDGRGLPRLPLRLSYGVGEALVAVSRHTAADGTFVWQTRLPQSLSPGRHVLRVEVDQPLALP